MVKAKELIGDKGVIFENMVSNLDNSTVYLKGFYFITTFITIMVSSSLRKLAHAIYRFFQLLKLKIQ